MVYGYDRPDLMFIHKLISIKHGEPLSANRRMKWMKSHAVICGANAKIHTHKFRCSSAEANDATERNQKQEKGLPIHFNHVTHKYAFDVKTI